MNFLRYIPLVALVSANILPIYGVLYLGWDAYLLFLLFWTETIVISLYTILKIILSHRWGSVLIVPFFIAVVGVVLLVHFVFITVVILYLQQFFDFGQIHSYETIGHQFLTIMPGILVLVVSHGVSFFVNYIKRHENNNYTASDYTKTVLHRIVIMHTAILMFSFLGPLFPSIIFLTCLMTVKIIFDIRAHKNEHSITFIRN